MSVLQYKTSGECRYDILSLGEVMLRFDPGAGRIHTARSFTVWEGGGEYNVARGLRRCFGLRAGVVTALADNPVGRLVEDFILQGGVDVSLIKWVPYDGTGRTVRNGLNFTERGFGIRGARGCSDRGNTAVSQLKEGDIDWEKAKADGVGFAMLRAGFGQGSLDTKFKRNISECNRLGIPCGIYWFSYAYTDDMAAKEALYAVEAVKPYKLEFPIAFDYEGDSQSTAKKNGVAVTKTLVSSLARAFCDAVEKAGYYAMVYTNPAYLSTYYDADITKQYDVWLAQWPAKPNLSSKPAQAGGIWQYTSSGSVSGISGRVDMDAAYINYPDVIAASGLNGLGGTTPSPSPEPEKTEEELAREWVMASDISDGTNPDAPVTRQQVWVMLYRMNGGK